ncbi:MAG: hypothetical protein RLZZ618_2020 [Pseudomonadota bacterium]
MTLALASLAVACAGVTLLASAEAALLPSTRTTLMGAATTATGFASEPVAEAPGTSVPFELSSVPDFAGYRAAVSRYLRARTPHRLNHVCVLGEQHGDGSRSAWVIWQEGREMVLWDGGREPLVNSRRTLNLRRDVVATEAEVAGSTYRVTRAWVRLQQQRCQRLGSRLELTRHQLNQRGRAAP